MSNLKLRHDKLTVSIKVKKVRKTRKEKMVFKLRKYNKKKYIEIYIRRNISSIHFQHYVLF